MAYKYGKRSKERMDGVNASLVECATRTLKKSKHDMTIPWMGGVRTSDEQHDIFKAGNSKCDGYNVKSYHQSGNAIDIIPVVGSYENRKAMNYFARNMLITWQEMLMNGEAKGVMVWGGTFGKKGWDAPHYEVRL